MKRQVYQCETDSYKEMEVIGRVRYNGESFGIDSLTNDEIYDVINVDRGDMLRVVDDSKEDYLYSLKNPRPIDGSSPGGKWELVEDFTGELSKFL
ncbi:hypothetical protein [Aerococcus christensenii]|uniref:Uncharacterized protein n=1 Tax=Aerococcus christensenii TaxID=87541 RepID=A0A0X8F8V8_9LACT|nr:hypothetical protein [Aerococcus christensenii]AMB92909.1 hypothetical protein AWM71_06280 [Aerococcus christensenii]KXB34873.1 hypothetical protein HMPREF3187_01262 [Aerococcus christensenii]MDK8233940.1 hypothetical protein [Aerococcus christensenii]WEB71513.1 hypothetical protein PUW42_02880 [Aerococcus christensenii]